MQSLARAGGSRRFYGYFCTLEHDFAKNDAKPRYTFAPLPNDSTYEKHALQNYAKRFASIRSQMLYPVELRAPEKNS